MWVHAIEKTQGKLSGWVELLVTLAGVSSLQIWQQILPINAAELVERYSRNCYQQFLLPHRITRTSSCLLMLQGYVTKVVSRSGNLRSSQY
ncbi:hypothetical protein, partial [Corynebacterium casei]|uniref:hypothetical protein n=1 Tax=Corynebacterium casei TaxID=160386 RepID=UPI003FCF7F86